MKNIFVAIVMLIAPAALRAGPSLESIERLSSLQNDYETPHTKWAKPYAGGTVRTLFLAQQSPNINALPLRHAVELMQRFDVSGDAVLAMTEKGNTYAITYRGGSGVYGGEPGEKRLDRLLEEPYDCYVVMGTVLGHIPAESRRTILSHVELGAGLVFVYGIEEEDEPVLEGFEPLDAAPAILSDVRELEFRCYARGRGRTVSLDKYPSDTRWKIYDPSDRQRLFGFGILATSITRSRAGRCSGRRGANRRRSSESTSARSPLRSAARRPARSV